MSKTSILQTSGLTYYFNRNQKTLEEIDLNVETGSIYGFLGPNGAGKTTTLRLVLGLLKKQQGSIKLFGKEFEQHRIESLRKIGSLIEQPSLYGHLTARENLVLYRNIYNVPNERIDHVLQLVGLSGTASKKSRQFSLGMKQRLSIAIALLHNPELLILDEPTNGLDPNGIIETRELIKLMNKNHGVTILVSSHILAEVERMATHVGIIHHGRLLFQGSLHDLQNMKKNQTLTRIETSDNLAALNLLPAEFNAGITDGFLVIPAKGKIVTAAINRLLVENNIDVYQILAQQNDLEQLFIDITTNNQ